MARTKSPTPKSPSALARRRLLAKQATKPSAHVSKTKTIRQRLSTYAVRPSAYIPKTKKRIDISAYKRPTYQRTFNGHLFRRGSSVKTIFEGRSVSGKVVKLNQMTVRIELTSPLSLEGKKISVPFKNVQVL